MDFKLHNGSGGLCCKSCSRQDNKLNTYDWLADIPGNAEESDMVEVQFKNTRKGYYRNSNKIKLEKGDVVAVEATPGHDIGVVTLTGRLVPLQMRKANIKPDVEIKRIYRKAKPVDMEKFDEAKAKEHATMIRSRQIAANLNLNMKIGDVEYQGDGNKAIFYYIADERVDFRQLIKVLAEAFRVRIEMKQIGARQEAGRIGGIGSCGRKLCCSTFWAGTLLCHLDDKFRICIYKCCPLSGYIVKSSKARRTMCKTEMLLKLRSRLLCRSTETSAIKRNRTGDEGRNILLL